MKQNLTLEAIALHQADERARLGRKDYYGLRETLQDQLDLQRGIVSSRFIYRDLSKKFDMKHNYNLGYPAKKIEQLPQPEYEGLKIYTIGRTLTRFGLLK